MPKPPTQSSCILLAIEQARRTGLPVRERPDATSCRERSRPRPPRGWKAAHPAEAAPWRGVVEDELVSFPRGRHDDIVDTLSYAVSEVTGKLNTPPRVYTAAGIRIPKISETVERNARRDALGISQREL